MATRLTRRRVRLLASSFRLRPTHRFEHGHNDNVVRGAEDFLARISQHGERVYLINGESGYGKSVLGMTLSLLPPREGLIPIYVDLTEAEDNDPLGDLRQILKRLGRGRERRLSGRPLFVIDALNETVDPIDLCKRLAGRRDDLHRLGARVLFLFGCRSPTYPGRLRSALLTRELGPIEQMELLFDLKSKTDLAFFPEVARIQGTGTPDPKQLASELRAYAANSPPGSLSREDLVAYLDWRHCSRHREPAFDPANAPSPASLRFTALTDRGIQASPSLDRLADISFGLLSQDANAMTFAEITSRYGVTKTTLNDDVAQSGLEPWVRCGSHHLRFESEVAVRAFGAIKVARALEQRQSPPSLRGRTAYDVCAPYLQPALRWMREADTGAASPDVVAGAVSAALRDRDGPYSFYATALCSERTSVFGDHLEGLNAALFEHLIIAIDVDRGQSNRASLEAAGQSAPGPMLDPVLDQLFEVIRAYSREAVEPLLATMETPPPLVQSQAAYLLLDWVGNVPMPLHERDRETLAKIPGRLRGQEESLHLRFHQVEILEALRAHFPDPKEIAGGQVVSKLTEIVTVTADEPELPGVAGIYSECQGLVTLRAKRLLHPRLTETAGERLGESVRGCIAAISTDAAFQTLGTDPAAEARLECWEVTLAFAVYASRLLRANNDLVLFVEAALEHPFWIVRWWAFSGLIGIVEDCGAEEEVLATRCARRAAEQLCTSVEPMGLKHRQCALVRKLLAEGSEAASRAMRTALRPVAAEHLSSARRQAFAEEYYAEMGASPDEYLTEFFRRLEEIVPARVES